MNTETRPQTPEKAKSRILGEAFEELGEIDLIIKRLSKSGINTWEEVAKCGSLRDQLRNITRGFRD